MFITDVTVGYSIADSANQIWWSWGRHIEYTQRVSSSQYAPGCTHDHPMQYFPWLRINVITTTLESISAQGPHFTKGLLVGVLFAAWMRFLSVRMF